MKTLIHNTKIINEGRRFNGSVLIEDELIKQIFNEEEVPQEILDQATVIDGSGKLLIPE